MKRGERRRVKLHDGVGVTRARGALAKLTQRRLLDEFKNVVGPGAGLIFALTAVRISVPVGSPTARGIELVGAFKVKGRQAHLFEIVLALRTPSSLAGGLDGRQQQGDQDADDGDDDQEFDDRERATSDVTETYHGEALERWEMAMPLIVEELDVNRNSVTSYDHHVDPRDTHLTKSSRILATFQG